MPDRIQRIEGVTLILILLIVGGAAGAASFTHVHDWTMQHVPAGTPGWFGWANACISELVPVAALLEIRRRRRHRQPVGYPLALLIAGACLSLAAQLAVAVPSPSGWLLSAVPALAFMALVKLVFARTPTKPVPAPVSTSTPRQSTPIPVPPPVRHRPYPWTAPAGTKPLPIIPAAIPAPEQATPVPRRPRTPVTHDRTRRTGKEVRDVELLAILTDQNRTPRDADGMVPVKRAMRILGTGPDRARRLLDQAGLRKRQPVPAPAR